MLRYKYFVAKLLDYGKIARSWGMDRMTGVVIGRKMAVDGCKSFGFYEIR
jgi:hypothetical protein